MDTCKMKHLEKCRQAKSAAVTSGEYISAHLPV